MKTLKRVLAAIALLALLAFGIGLEYSLTASAATLTARILVLIIFNATLVALFTLTFFIGKSLLKLILDNKNKSTGYRFKTKLVTTFLAVTMIPSAMLFVIASGLVTNYVDKWFNPVLIQPLTTALSLSRDVYELIRTQTLEEAERIKRGVTPRPQFTVDRIKASSGDHSDSIKNAFKGVKNVEVISRDRVDIIRAVLPITKGSRVTEVLVVDTVVPPNITRQVGEIKDSYKEYVNLREFKLPLKSNYLIILGFFTLFSVFLALWIALRISRGITEPIDSLVKATSRISEGNLNTVVESTRDDEIGMLINSFNSMVAKIRNAEVSLHNAYMESDRRRLLLENIIDNINSGVIYLDSSMTVVAINGTACTILDIEPQEVAGDNYVELLTNIDSPELEHFIKEINLASFHSKKEQLKVSIHGKKMELRIFIIQLQDALLNPAGLLVVFDDLTDLILAEKALVWQDVAKRITHEIKNPLTPIKLSAERLLKRWHSHDENFGVILEKAANTIVREVDSLKRLVDEFSRLGKMPDITPKPTVVASLINEVIDLYRDYEHARFTVEDLSRKRVYPVDPEQFKRVIINIIDNATQAVEENGIIEIGARILDFNGRLVIEIADNGRGISDVDKEKLFQPYFSKRKNGTGLGLAIAHRIVAEHKGTIAVRDNAPRGAVFRIEIPL